MVLTVLTQTILSMLTILSMPNILTISMILSLLILAILTKKNKIKWEKELRGKMGKNKKKWGETRNERKKMIRHKFKKWENNKGKKEKEKRE